MENALKLDMSPAFKEELFHNALCNGLGYMSGHGLRFSYEDVDYQQFREAGDCFEDVIMKILKGGKKIKFVDVEGDGENDSEITLQDMYERVELVEFRWISDMVQEQDDADTADAILQTVFFKEILFG